MVDKIKKSRSKWLTAPGTINNYVFSIEELRKKEEQNLHEQQLTKKYWKIYQQTLGKCMICEDKQINLDTYEDGNSEEQDIVVLPKGTTKNPIIKVWDSPKRNPGKCQQVVVIDEEGSYQVKENEELQNASYFVSRLIEQRLEIIQNNQLNGTVNKKLGKILPVQPVLAELKDASNFKNFQKCSNKDKISNQNNDQIASNNCNEAEILDITSIPGKSSEANNLNGSSLEPINQIWYPLRHAGQVPLAFLSDWKFKGVEKVNIDFGAQYSSHEIFHKLFTPEIYAYITQATYEKQKRKLRKRIDRNLADCDEELVQFSPYEIDAFIALIFSFHCLEIPNNINIMRNEQALMLKPQLQSLLYNFSLGFKRDNDLQPQSSDNQNAPENRLQFILKLFSDNFKAIINPKEYLGLVSKDLGGQEMDKGQIFTLKESRLIDQSINYILDLQFNKLGIKIDNEQKERVMVTQANMLEYYKNQGYKIVITKNDGFDVDTLRSLRQINIGIITEIPLNEVQLTSKQIKEIEGNHNTTSHFFIHDGQIASAVTPHSYGQIPDKKAYISNFMAITSPKDTQTPKMERLFLEMKTDTDYKNLEMRNVAGIRWELVVFVRIIDAVVHNCLRLYNMTSDKGNQLKKHELIFKLGDYFQQKYHGHTNLQAKLLQSQIQSKDIRLHFSREMLGAKRIECLICGVKTKNYCLQCSEKDKMQVGFCGSPACNEKHNAIPAMLLNEQVANKGEQRERGQNLQSSQNYRKASDKAYESGYDSARSLQQVSQFNFGASRRRENVGGISNKPRGTDGYASESRLSQKSRIAGGFQDTEPAEGFGSLSSIRGGSSFNPQNQKGGLQTFQEPNKDNLTLGERLLLQKQNKQNNTNANVSQASYNNNGNVNASSQPTGNSQKAGQNTGSSISISGNDNMDKDKENFSVDINTVQRGNLGENQGIPRKINNNNGLKQRNNYMEVEVQEKNNKDNNQTNLITNGNKEWANLSQETRQNPKIREMLLHQGNPNPAGNISQSQETSTQQENKIPPPNNNAVQFEKSYGNNNNNSGLNLTSSSISCKNKKRKNQFEGTDEEVLEVLLEGRKKKKTNDGNTEKSCSFTAGQNDNHGESATQQGRIKEETIENHQNNNNNINKESKISSSIQNQLIIAENKGKRVEGNGEQQLKREDMRATQQKEVNNAKKDDINLKIDENERIQKNSHNNSSKNNTTNIQVQGGQLSGAKESKGKTSILPSTVVSSSAKQLVSVENDQNQQGKQQTMESGGTSANQGVFEMETNLRVNSLDESAHNSFDAEEIRRRQLEKNNHKPNQHMIFDQSQMEMSQLQGNASADKSGLEINSGIQRNESQQRKVMPNYPVPQQSGHNPITVPKVSRVSKTSLLTGTIKTTTMVESQQQNDSSNKRDLALKSSMAAEIQTKLESSMTSEKPLVDINSLEIKSNNIKPARQIIKAFFGKKP